MNILFHENQLCERGTTVALYDYAWFTHELLGVNPVITYNKRSENNKEMAIEKFKKEFIVIGYEDFSEVPGIIDQYRIDAFYAIKAGDLDGVIVPNAKNLIHSVFCNNSETIHGDVYAVISEWMSIVSGDHIPYVPHMLNLPDHTEDLRKFLNIPKDAFVIGRYGGYNTFDVYFARDSISTVLEKRKDIWFLFMNTYPVYTHERCLYLDLSYDNNIKKAFVNTCDAMLHARVHGETFGLAVLEFAAYNKQIISYDNYVGGRNHFMYLQGNCHVYRTKEMLDDILLNINRRNRFDTTYLKDKFSPKNVVAQFNRVFLENTI